MQAHRRHRHERIRGGTRVRRRHPHVHVPEPITGAVVAVVQPGEDPADRDPGAGERRVVGGRRRGPPSPRRRAGPAQRGLDPPAVRALARVDVGLRVRRADHVEVHVGADPAPLGRRSARGRSGASRPARSPRRPRSRPAGRRRPGAGARRAARPPRARPRRRCRCRSVPGRRPRSPGARPPSRPAPRPRARSRRSRCAWSGGRRRRSRARARDRSARDRPRAHGEHGDPQAWRGQRAAERRTAIGHHQQGAGARALGEPRPRRERAHPAPRDCDVAACHARIVGAGTAESDAPYGPAARPEPENVSVRNALGRSPDTRAGVRSRNSGTVNAGSVTRNPAARRRPAT